MHPRWSLFGKGYLTSCSYNLWILASQLLANLFHHLNLVGNSEYYHNSDLLCCLQASSYCMPSTFPVSQTQSLLWSGSCLNASLAVSFSGPKVKGFLICESSLRRVSWSKKRILMLFVPMLLVVLKKCSFLIRKIKQKFWKLQFTNISRPIKTKNNILSSWALEQNWAYSS